MGRQGRPRFYTTFHGCRGSFLPAEFSHPFLEWAPFWVSCFTFFGVPLSFLWPAFHVVTQSITMALCRSQPMMLFCFPHPGLNALDHKRLYCRLMGLQARSFPPHSLLSLISFTITSCLYTNFYRACYLELYFSITGSLESGDQEWEVNREWPLFLPYLSNFSPWWECVEIITTLSACSCSTVINAGWRMYTLSRLTQLTVHV